MAEGMTLTQYAAERGITVQSASQSFKRHKKDMAGMFETRGRAVVLNEQGIEFLDNTRAKLPAPIVNQDTLIGLKERVRTLEKQVEDDRAEIQRLQDMVMQKDALLAQKDQLITIKDGQMLMLTTTKGKKGIFGRVKEWFMGTEAEQLPEPEPKDVQDM